MSKTQEHPAAHWRDQVSLLLDGRLAPEARAKLSEKIRTDAKVRGIYLEYVVLHAATLRALGVNFGAKDRKALNSSAPNPQRLRWPIAAALAAAVLLAAAAVAVYLLTTDPQSEAVQPQSRGVPVATLIESTGTVIVNNGIGNPGDEYAAGAYSIESGSAGFLLTNRVGVELRGRTRLTMQGNMASTLDYGSASFRCPPGSEGYTVRLPDGSRVVDLGTEFAVWVDDDGASEVWVFEGQVEIGIGSSRRILDGGDGAILREGALIAPGMSDKSEINTAAVRFDADQIVAYAPGKQDGQHDKPTRADVLEDGRMLRLTGNAWKTIPFAYDVTENTMIEAEFRARRPGEIYALGFLASDREGFFGALQVWGDENVDSIPREHALTEADGWVRVTLPVGRHYTGRYERLLFVCDDDASGDADGWFRNVRVYEQTKDENAQPTSKEILP